MAKKGRLSRSEREFILNNQHINPGKIAEELGRTTEVVLKVIEEWQAPKEEDGFKLFNIHRNSVVMSQEASQAGDKVVVNKSKSLDPTIYFQPFKK